jgi:hypothetical protein
MCSWQQWDSELLVRHAIYFINRCSNTFHVSVHVHVDGVRQCLRTVATSGSIAHPPSDMYEYGELWWNCVNRVTEDLGENCIPVPLFPPQIWYGLTQVRTRACAVRGHVLFYFDFIILWCFSEFPKITVLLNLVFLFNFCITDSSLEPLKGKVFGFVGVLKWPEEWDFL